jgi:hypothetical protein
MVLMQDSILRALEMTLPAKIMSKTFFFIERAYDVTICNSYIAFKMARLW